MATSGQVQGNHVNIGGRPNNFVFINWQLAGQNIAGNYSAINWQLYFHFDGADAQLDNGYANVGDGIRWSNGGRIYNYAGNFSTRDLGIASGSFNIGHDNNGNRNLYVAAGMTPYQTARSEGGGNFSLPTIPRHSAVTNAIGDTDDENTNPWVEFNNPAGTAVDVYLDLPNLGVGGIARRYNVGSRHTWTLSNAEKDQIRAAMVNVPYTIIRYVVHDTLGGDSWTWIDRYWSIINANPTFSDFNYTDTNSAVSAVTGDNQVLVQGKSTVAATVSSAQKMVALKQANPVNYTATLDGNVNTQAYSAGSTVTFPIGVIAGSGEKTLSVRAVDSRGNSTTVNKPVTVIPYTSPDLVYTAVRENNFEDATTINVSGVFSRVTIGGTDKNSIVAGSLEYRKRQDGGAWGAWTDLTFTQTAGAFTADTIILSLLNSSVWDFEVRVTDQFETRTESFSVERGVPILMIGDDNRIGVNQMPPDTGAPGLYLTPEDNLWLQIYAVGDVFTSTINANPADRFGGTWIAQGTLTTAGTVVTLYVWKRTA